VAVSHFLHAINEPAYQLLALSKVVEMQTARLGLMHPTTLESLEALGRIRARDVGKMVLPSQRAAERKVWQGVAQAAATELNDLRLAARALVMAAEFCTGKDNRYEGVAENSIRRGLYDEALQLLAADGGTNELEAGLVRYKKSTKC
jgi:hypothetical protein